MSKLVVHAKTMIDGVSDTPKKDQLISMEDGKIVSIEDYHETNEEVVHLIHDHQEYRMRSLFHLRYIVMF